MNIICIIDNEKGLMFNHRRLSLDRAVREKIIELSSKKILWMNKYTYSQFKSWQKNFRVAEDFLKKAGADDNCFVEDQALSPYKDRINIFYLFYWNRDYPSDLKLDVLPWDDHMKLIKTEDFPGCSHDLITLEVWRK